MKKIITGIITQIVFGEAINHKSAQFQLLNIVPGAYLCKILIKENEISKTLIKTN